MKCELYLITSKKSGFLKRESCVITFFEDEVLVTTISKEKLKELYANSKEETKASGGGFFRQMVNASKVLSEYADKVSSMDIEEIKKENTEVIKKSSIKKLRYRNYSEVVDMENNNTSKSEGKLVLVLDNKKMKFYHNYRDKNIKEYINKYLK